MGPDIELPASAPSDFGSALVDKLRAMLMLGLTAGLRSPTGVIKALTGVLLADVFIFYLIAATLCFLILLERWR